MSNSTKPNDSYFSNAERSAIWTIWLTYGSFYFCRTNISVAVPGLGASIAEGGAGLSGEEIGLILASLKLTYGFGQLVNGQIAEKISPRILLAIGMLGSAALNVLFGFSTGFYFLLFVWAVNGYSQALGWTPCMRVMGNWIPFHKRGRAIGFIGTGYQITAGLTYFVAGQSAEMLGWRAALYVPAALLTAAALYMLVFLKGAPDGRNQDDVRQDDIGSTETGRPSLARNVWLTFTNPALWLLGLSLGLLNASRYGFVDWGITHLTEVQGTGVGKASLKYLILPLGAVVGSYTAGWMTDRFFGGRRAPVICGLLVTLGVLTLVYEYVSRVSVPATLFLLVLIGYCIYGPQVLLVGTAPSDLAKRGTTAAAAGFVNFLGYMGAATGDTITGYYKMEEHGGWEVAIYIWAGWAFGLAFFAALLWNAKSET